VAAPAGAPNAAVVVAIIEQQEDVIQVLEVVEGEPA
jgi:hypothetical protein